MGETVILWEMGLLFLPEAIPIKTDPCPFPGPGKQSRAPSLGSVPTSCSRPQCSWYPQPSGAAWPAVGTLSSWGAVGFVTFVLAPGQPCIPAKEEDTGSVQSTLLVPGSGKEK